jgi:hypothetical protein
MLSSTFYTASTKPVFKNPFRIEEKIFVRISLLASGMQITLKCLTNQGESEFLPPPGGAEHAMIVVSSTSFQ